VPERNGHRASSLSHRILAQHACKSDIGDPIATPFAPLIKTQGVAKPVSSIANSDWVTNLATISVSPAKF
jgi:hypothetical protein